MAPVDKKHVNVERRTWDKETYEARAKARTASTNEGASSSTSPDRNSGGGDDGDNDTKEEFQEATRGAAGPSGSKRAFLKSRSQKVDLESKVGTTDIIDPAAAAATRSYTVDDDPAVDSASSVTKCTDGVGWHCKVCDCFLKDSLTYLDHINGRKHQRHLGFTMRVEKSTTAQVSGTLSVLAESKRAKEEEDRKKSGAGLLPSKGGGGNEVDFEDIVRAKDEEAMRRKAERARKREERKRKEKIEVEEAKVLVHGGGGADEEGEEEEGEDDLGGGMDPAFAAMMGFSGFGGSRK